MFSLFQCPGWRFGHQLYQHRGTLGPYEPRIHEVHSGASGLQTHPSSWLQSLWASTQWGQWGAGEQCSPAALRVTGQLLHFSVEPSFWSSWIWEGAGSSQEKKVRCFPLEENCRERGKGFFLKIVPITLSLYQNAIPLLFPVYLHLKERQLRKPTIMQERKTTILSISRLLEIGKFDIAKIVTWTQWWLREEHRVTSLENDLHRLVTTVDQ